MENKFRTKAGKKKWLRISACAAEVMRERKRRNRVEEVESH